MCLMMYIKGAESKHLSQPKPRGSFMALGKALHSEGCQMLTDRGEHKSFRDSSCSLAAAGSGTNPGVACIDHRMQQLVSHISRQGLRASPAPELCSPTAVHLNSWIWAKRDKVSLEFYVYNCFTIDRLLEAEIMIAFQAPSLDQEGSWCSKNQQTEELWYIHSFEHQCSVSF